MRVLALTLLLLSLNAKAQENAQASSTSDSQMSSQSYDELNSRYQVRMNSNDSRLTFGAYGQFSTFKRQGLSLVGWTLEVPVTYAITDTFATQISINQSIDISKSLSVLFTGFHFGGAWAFSGAFTQRKAELLVNGTSTVNVASVESSLWALEGGLDQILFNGSGRVVPATGVSFGIRSDFNLFGYRTSGMFRYGSLIITDEPVTMLTTGLGLLIRY